jgi:DNA invertase Pin-like site-specific DNA recombinase
MSEMTKVTSLHVSRTAIVYVRQSSATQVENNRESTARQYALKQRAEALGWPTDRIVVIDDDLGLSGATAHQRNGFARLAAEVALAHVGIVLGLEVSRLARNNTDWYRLLDLCSMTNTLIGDADGVYHPSLFNDRLLLGLKGTMSEAELHVLRARLDGGIRNKAARGELRRGLPIGFVWGDADGEVLFHPDEAVRSAVRAVFERFQEFGSARRVWLWFRSEGLAFPLQIQASEAIRWVAPTYFAIYNILRNPVYAGAYVYGKSRREYIFDEHGNRHKRTRFLPREQWAVLLRTHHEGYIDWPTFEANEVRLAANTKPQPHQAGAGPLREGAALLQGLAACGHCGRKLHTHYRGRLQTPGYHCSNKGIENGRGVYCLNVGGLQIDAAVTQAFLSAIAPAGLLAVVQAAEHLQADHDGALAQWRLALERAEYDAQRAERRYRAVDPENRLVARGVEAQWEESLRVVQRARAELTRRQEQRPHAVTDEQRRRLLCLGDDLQQVWNAPTTSLRDKKELLRTLLEEVSVSVYREEFRALLKLRWRGGMLSEIDVNLPRSRPATVRTDEDTVALVRRLATYHDDAAIAGILNRQERTTARGLRFTQTHVGNLRRSWDIPRCTESKDPSAGDLMSIRQTAKVLGIAPSTIHRWLKDGFIVGEQITPGAPWQVRVNDALRARLVQKAPEGYLPMQDATKRLGVTRQTVLQRVKRGELEAVLLHEGRRKGLRIKVSSDDPGLFEHTS